MRLACLLAVGLVAGCSQSSGDHPPLSIIDGPVGPDAALPADGASPAPDAATTPDAPPDAASTPDTGMPATPMCGDGVRSPGEICFATPTAIAAGGPVYSARLADVDGDGHRDLVYLTATGVVFRPGDGAGGFGAPVAGPATDSWWLAVGDIDGDGVADLAAAGRYQVTVWLGTGGGAFGAAHQLALPDGPVGLSVAQVDGYPGDEVVVATGQYFDVWTWFAGDLNELYSQQNPYWGTYSATYTALATGDIDGDGRADSIVPVTEELLRFAGGVDGVSLQGYVPSDAPAAGLALANVDADPQLDLIAAEPDPPQLAIYSKAERGPSSSQYATALVPVTGGTPRLVDAADLDGDGVGDLVAGLTDTARLQAYHPDGTAGPTIQLAEPMTCMHFDGDINGDGIADLVVTLQDEIVVVPSGAP